MIDTMKLLFAKLTILIALFSLAFATFYFAQKHPLSQAFQLGTLVALGVLVGVAIFLYVLSLLLMPVASRFEKTRDDNSPQEEESLVVPREERIIRHDTKEAYTEHSRTERMKIHEAQQKLAEMAGEQGTVEEVLLLLPLDLAFLLAKESIKNLFFGKINEENEEAGTIVGSAGFGSSPQEIRLSVQSITQHSSKINIISKSPQKQQSDIKNSSYIKKISNFLRDKEKFYTE